MSNNNVQFFLGNFMSNNNVQFYMEKNSKTIPKILALEGLPYP